MSLAETNQPPSPWPHRWAWILACATFPLIWWGGFVTSTDAGMAFRDWLTSDGHFMLVYPWLSSTGDKFIEHGHRLLGVLVGVLSIVLVVVAHRCEPRRSVRWFSLALLGGVVAQGVLGGLRVVLDQRTLALVHGCTGPLFFAMCAAMVVVTSQRWQSIGEANDIRAASLTRVAVVVATLAYLQLVLGAIVRHMPQMTTPAAATIFQTAVYFHLLVALILVAYVIALAWRSWRTECCRLLGCCLALLVICQLALGMATWLVKYGVPRGLTDVLGEHGWLTVEASFAQAAIVTSHVAVGSLIVAVSLAVAMLALRSSGWRAPQVHSPSAGPRKAVA